MREIRSARRELFEQCFVRSWTELEEALGETAAVEIELAFDEGIALGRSTEWTCRMLHKAAPARAPWPAMGVLPRALVLFAEGYGSDAIARVVPGPDRIDLALAGGAESLVGERNWAYPACYDVLVEHEHQRQDLETETWRLLFCPAVVKVLVCYDDRSDGDPVVHAPWLEGKLAQLSTMLRRAVAAGTVTASEGAGFLVLIGRRGRTHPGIASWVARSLDGSARMLWRRGQRYRAR